MVATVFNLTSASSTVHYFRREGHGLGTPANDPGSSPGQAPGTGPGQAPGSSPGQAEAGDYYARKGDEHRKASRWRGSGAAALGLTGHVEPGEFRRVLQGYVPGTDIRLGRLRDGEHEHRPGVDITLSAPKSVSLEALLGGPGAARAMRAHEAAVRATLDYIETRLLRTRRWSREERRSVQVNAPALVAATFRHITSRNNDPQLHTHCVVANMTRYMEQWRSAEIGLLRRSEKLIGAFYRNELAWGLRKAGFALRPSMIGRVPGFEISGWPRAVLEAFSSRRRQIVKYIREKGWRYNARAAQAATLATRARKNEPRRADLEALWQAFAEEHGLAKRTLRKIGVRRPVPPTALEIAWQALEQLEERASVFPVRDALALALAHSPGLYRLEEIEGAFAELRRDKHLLPAIRRGVGEAWTTARAVGAEREVRERTLGSAGAVGPLARGPVPEEAVEGLTEGQREAVRLILESRDRVVGVQGYAGTGKTTMLRRAVSCMAERRVLGLAPSASAARTLSRETGLACRTLQWFLTRCQEVSDGVADARTLAALRERYRGAVVVVDEMSLAGTAQARALLRIADRLEVARLVLVGDSRQLRGVQAGQPFRQMQQAGMAVAEMDDIRRQQNPDLLAAVQDMVEGEPGEALERLGGNLRELPAEEIARIAAALWLRLSPGARAGTALLVPTRALRAEVEEAVREGLEAEGALHGSSIEIETLVPLNLTRTEASDPRNWREGDIALFNRERKNYRIAKDDACTVMEVEEDRVILAHPDGRPRHLKPGGDLRYRLDLFEGEDAYRPRGRAAALDPQRPGTRPRQRRPDGSPGDPRRGAAHAPLGRTRGAARPGRPAAAPSCLRLCVHRACRAGADARPGDRGAGLRSRAAGEPADALCAAQPRARGSGGVDRQPRAAGGDAGGEHGRAADGAGGHRRGGRAARAEEADGLRRDRDGVPGRPARGAGAPRRNGGGLAPTGGGRSGACRSPRGIHGRRNRLCRDGSGRSGRQADPSGPSCGGRIRAGSRA